MEPIVQNLISAVVMALVGLLLLLVKLGLNKLTTYLEAKMGKEHVETLKALADTIVRSLAQSPAFEGLANEEKKQMAILAITRWANDKNIPIKREFVDSLIEEAVQKMKAELPEVGVLLEGEG